MKLNKLPNITSVRFFLALLVVLFHIPQFCRNRNFPFFDNLPIFHKGAEAVSMFFALSGFLIIRQLYIEKQLNDSISLKNFYRRRILRIFPLYYFVLIFGLIYYNYILQKFGFKYESNVNIFEGILLGGTFFSNVLATYNPGGIIEVLWSLGVEEQFYLFIAPTMLILPKDKILLFLGIFTIGYFCIFHSVDKFDKFGMHYYYFSVSGFFSILVLRYKNLKIPNYLEYFLVLSFVLYFTTSVFKDNLSVVVYHIVSMFLFTFTICILIRKPLMVLDNKYFKYLGEISYGIYMLHAIIMQLIGFVFLKYFSKYGLNYSISIIMFNSLVLCLTILVAHLSYKYYESYFLSLKKR